SRDAGLVSEAVVAVCVGAGEAVGDAVAAGAADRGGLPNRLWVGVRPSLRCELSDRLIVMLSLESRQQPRSVTLATVSNLIRPFQLMIGLEAAPSDRLQTLLTGI